MLLGFVFVCLGGIPAYRPEVFRVYRLLERAAEGCPRHGPVHLLFQSAAVIGFRLDPGNWLGIGLVCPF